MALQPFQRRIAVPDEAGGSPTQLVNADTGDISRELKGVSQQILKTAEPYLREDRIEEGLKDFAADGLGKDENGNYIVPDTPDGGTVYRAAYEQAKFAEYKIKAQNQFELQLNELARESLLTNKPPSEFTSQAMNLLEGVIEGTPIEMRPEMFEAFTREVRQRDLSLGNSYIRIERDNINKTISAEVNKLRSEAQDAAWSGTEEGIVQSQINIQKAAENQRILIEYGLAPEGSDQILLDQSASLVGAGAFMQTVNSQQDLLNSGDFEGLANILENIAPTDGDSIIGFNHKEIFELIPDLSTRRQLATLLRRRGAQLEAGERADAAMNQSLFDLNNIPIGEGKPFGMTPKRYKDAVLQFFSSNGLDPFSAEGINQGVARFGSLPVNEFYKDELDDFMSQGGKQLEDSYQLWRRLTTAMTPEGEEVDLASGHLSADENAFWYHYDFASQSGLEPTEAKKLASSMVTEKLGTVSKMTEMLRNVTRADGTLWGLGDPGITQEELFDLMDDELGVDWGDLNTEAQEYLITHAAQGVNNHVKPRAAFTQAARVFKENMVQDPLSIESAGRESSAFVPKNEAVRGVTNPADPKGPGSTEYASRAVSVAVQEMADLESIESLVKTPPGEWELGKNLFLRHTGRHHTVRSAGWGAENRNTETYYLAYFDPETGLPPVALQSKEGGVLVIDMSLARRKSQGQVNKFLTERGRSLDEINDLKREPRPNKPEYRPLGYVAPANTRAYQAEVNEREAKISALEKEHERRFGNLESIEGSAPGGVLAGYQREVARRREEDQDTIFSANASITADMLRAPEAELRIVSPLSKGSPLASMENRQSISTLAQQMQVDPVELVAIALYESADSMDPSKVGGAGGGYQGIFQFGAWERSKYQVDKNSSFSEQVAALGRFLVDRGYRPGMGWKKLYTTINAGNPYAKVTTADENGNQVEHYKNIKDRIDRARHWLARN
jgi:hypothetical protein